MEICVPDSHIALDPPLPILLYYTYSHIRFVHCEKRSLYCVSSCEALREIRIIPLKLSVMLIF